MRAYAARSDLAGLHGEPQTSIGESQRPSPASRHYNPLTHVQEGHIDYNKPDKKNIPLKQDERKESIELCG
jgi:hypothetical protein